MLLKSLLKNGLFIFYKKKTIRLIIRDFIIFFLERVKVDEAEAEEVGVGVGGAEVEAGDYVFQEPVCD